MSAADTDPLNESRGRLKTTSSPPESFGNSGTPVEAVPEPPPLPSIEDLHALRTDWVEPDRLSGRLRVPRGVILLASGLAAGVVVGVVLVGQVGRSPIRGVTITAPPVTVLQTSSAAAPSPAPASAVPAPAPSTPTSRERARQQPQPQPQRSSGATHAIKRPSAVSHPRPTHKLGCPVRDDHGNIIAWNC